ncbi:MULTISPECIES: hypothetical protein [Bacillus]|uniref:hypothetical protein n=1 Tax=Bacillus TaxID=1386 RepID=UPI001E290032|nr:MULTISPECIES: hypothetical protein [Bacillus]
MKSINGNVSVMIQGAITYRYNERFLHPSAIFIKLVILSCVIEKVKFEALNLYELIHISSLLKTGESGIALLLYMMQQG